MRNPERRLVLLEEAEIRAEMEELVLDHGEHRGQLWNEPTGEGDADHRVELVDGAKRGNTECILGHALPAAQPGRAVVSLARVDPCQPGHPSMLAPSTPDVERLTSNASNR